MPSRLAARLITGPAGHLVASALDWLAVLARILLAKARRRPVRW